MEYLTIELDCTDDRCGKCRFVVLKSVSPLNVCGYFNKELSIDETVYELQRLPECIETCKKHKDKVG